jgi:hypothetical protein
MTSNGNPLFYSKKRGKKKRITNIHFLKETTASRRVFQFLPFSFSYSGPFLVTQCANQPASFFILKRQVARTLVLFCRVEFFSPAAAVCIDPPFCLRGPP